MPIKTDNFQKQFMTSFKNDTNGQKILSWLKGKKIEDAPQKTKNTPNTIDLTTPNTVTITGQFGDVSIEFVPKGTHNKIYKRGKSIKTRKDAYFLESNDTIGNRSEIVYDFNKAIYMVTFTTWHTIIRGIIG